MYHLHRLFLHLVARVTSEFSKVMTVNIAYLIISNTLSSIRLTQLMSLLCNTTQANSFPLRDACIACFTQAAEFEPGPRQLLALSQCATIYLTASGYQLCAQNLAVS